MARKPIFRNRRAEVPDFISDVFSFFMYLLFFLIFFLIFTMRFGGCDSFEPASQAIISEADEAVADSQLLLNYARTELTIDDRQLTFSELTAESCVNGNFEQLIEENKKLMGGGVSLVSIFQLSLNCDPGQDNEVIIYRYEPPPECPYTLQCLDSLDSPTIDIPLPHKDGNIGYAILTFKKCAFYSTYTHPHGTVTLPMAMDDPLLIDGGCLR